jgi:hypothetical protein
MGSKSPDRLRNPPSPEQALTLAEIHLQGWTLRASCSKCGVDLRVNVGSLIRIYGPDKVWWGARPACPVWDCPGQLTYSARALNGGTWRSMRESAPERLVTAWKTRREARDLGPR